ncbi:MAG: EndoU domain-containing protein [Bacteroidota bacterium]
MSTEFLEYNGLTIPQELACGLPVRLYHHIFYGRVSKNFKIYGVHHEHALTQKESDFEKGDLKLVEGSKSEHANGFYTAQVQCWNGKSWIAKTSENGFFPDSWTEKQVMEEIAQARAKLTIDNWLPPVPPNKKSNVYLQQTSCGQNLVFYLGKPRKNRPPVLDKYIVTVFPYFE